MLKITRRSLRRCVTMETAHGIGRGRELIRRENTMAGKKGQHYLTEDERYIVEGMLLAGAGPTEIARKMGICRQTV